jgi:hypothetical protein
MSDWFKAVSDAAQFVEAVGIVLKLRAIQSRYNVIATKYYSHFKQQRDFYYNTFQMQGEGPFVFEQFGIAFYNPDYYGMNNTGYLTPGAWFLFNPQITNRMVMMGNQNIEGYWKRFAERYSPNVASTVLDTSSYAIDVASVNDDWNSYMNRYEEHKRDVLNERRWANMVNALDYGTKTGSQIERGMATSFDVFDTAQGQLVSSLDTIGNGLATSFGYRRMQTALKDELGTVPMYDGHFFLER